MSARLERGHWEMERHVLPFTAELMEREWPQRASEQGLKEFR